MKKIEPGSDATRSLDVAAANIERIGAIFPEVVTGGKVSFDALRALLGDSVDDNDGRFGLNWHGKGRARNQELLPDAGTLLPRPSDSIDWDTTKNIVIEGDNLVVLKLLQRSYTGKVKLIYIDPPYNTGKDFIYPDNFSDSIGDYLRITGQANGSDGLLTTNPEKSGRYHTDWLNMMYPRLKLSRSLLRNDGVLIVSISDAETHHLRCVLDEIYGGNNFIGCVIWNSTKSVTNTAILSVSHTYNLIYARDRDYFVKNRTHFRLAENGDGFSNPDGDPRGPWKADPFQVGGVRPNQQYPIKNPKTGKIYFPNPGNSWKNDKTMYEKLDAEGRIVFGATGEAGPQRKRYQSEATERGRVANTWWDKIDTTTNATNQMKKLMGSNMFDTPKPVSLVREFIQLGIHDKKDALVLDFFAGSGTTGQAVVEQNAQDGGERRYILVQLPEPLDKGNASQKDAAAYCEAAKIPKNLAALTRERLRRFRSRFTEELPNFAGDIGFRSFALARSNLKEWDPDPDDLDQALLDSVDNIRENRTGEDIFFEILLKRGLDLSEAVERLDIAGKPSFATADGKLLVIPCEQINDTEIETIAEDIIAWQGKSRKTDSLVILRDTAFQSDVAKGNLSEILAQRGITEVWSL